MLIGDKIDHTPTWRSDETILYTDGSYFPTWNVAAWAVINLQENTKMTGGVLGSQTNNRAELTAILAAITYIIKKGIGKAKIITDSKYAIDGVFGDQRRMTNSDLWDIMDSKTKTAKLTRNNFEWTPSHQGTIGNGIADIAARNEATKIARRRQQYDPAQDGWDESEQNIYSQRWVYDPTLDGWEPERPVQTQQEPTQLWIITEHT